MDKAQKLQGVLELCEDLQGKVHLGEINLDIESLRFSCDLLLRNMIMVFEKEKNNQDFTKELNYIINNLLGSHRHLTSEDVMETAHRFKID